MNAIAVFKNRWLAFLMLLPTLVVLGLFLYYPALETLRLSLYRANFVFQTETFVGLAQFQQLLTDPAYYQSLLQTVIFCALVVFLGLAFGLSLAILANQPIHGAAVYRSLLLYPYALSPAIAGTLWLFMFNPEVGLVNNILRTLFGIAPRWLDNPILAFTLVVFAAVWKNIGYNLAFYTAALQNLPGELLEAAALDGATPWQRFRYVTLPLLSPITFFLFFVNLTYAVFDTFSLVDILTAGGPTLGKTGITTFLIYRVYQDGFQNFQTGFAAAQAILMLIMVGGITVLQFRVGRRVNYGA
ncbi:carbohydrate ABC transporter permease [Meiothermus granaticius]|uniref:sn-glycerol-3-phosphate transport system permease protein UgpA n=1 Tax=Meiothermus granaticius NBRC 107808 TaxID=1227551 RepID=A0A399F8T2_9DEIN|nr:sugar ABC transporter permease [Meiothermus granaticius]RIH93077.1 sn-glycerol-3-phosphate transport system permease protein UgpA [Meiothermus granaticius NBRC 107808]GEM86648.1 glycerol-3-phosphate transporter permease [Meiothermus granaticius NBRC 107808]